MIDSFFFDFDGTLQGFENHEISDSTIEALKLLKQKNKKIYIATGRNMVDMPEHIFEYGFDGYLLKPIDQDKLFELIDKYLK